MTEVRSIPADAVVRLVRRHQDEVWRYVRYLGASTELADDLVQEAFLQLLRAPFRESSEAETAGWLRTVVRNLYVRSFRRPPFEHAELDELESTWRTFAQDDGGADALVHLRHCVDGLSGRLRDVVRWHYEERCSRKVIGERLGLGEDGVKSLLRRTRQALKTCVEQRREAGA
ncbi:MAG: sigma-70 family RNA polymerase sigma factor [Planctomycetes bacterium]|nr:sigma-70 family RNA polymerase sigma factor [Planctomycetota bacterium]